MRELTVDEVRQVAGGRDQFKATPAEYAAYQSMITSVGDFIGGMVTGMVGGWNSGG